MAEFDYRISGHDFVRALMLAGYRLVRTTSTGQVVMLSDEKIELVIPKREYLDEATILSILETAKMLPLQLVGLLNRLGSRDTMAEQSELSGAQIQAQIRRKK